MRTVFAIIGLRELLNLQKPQDQRFPEAAILRKKADKER